METQEWFASALSANKIFRISVRLHVKCPIFLSNLKNIWNLSACFLKVPNIKFHENWSNLRFTDISGRTDMTKLTGAFRELCERASKRHNNLPAQFAVHLSAICLTTLCNSQSKCWIAERYRIANCKWYERKLSNLHWGTFTDCTYSYWVSQNCLWANRDSNPDISRTQFHSVSSSHKLLG
jgi:hypothetical protein